MAGAGLSPRRAWVRTIFGKGLVWLAGLAGSESSALALIFPGASAALVKSERKMRRLRFFSRMSPSLVLEVSDVNVPRTRSAC